ncbi:MAG: hypothetical protein E7040_02535 [Lentisphaerae bacterium]|nr:hypothetical protein [Lentisphaerota bacterium]
MLKLNASYSKKVPAGGEYSSQSYHASIEVELPDGLNQEQLQNRIHETFALVRESVEAELHGRPARQLPEPAAQPVTSNQTVSQPVSRPANNHSQKDVAASPKQIKYLLDLGRNLGWTPQQIAAKCNVADVHNLTRRQCSDLINEWKAVA